jgi:ABC-type dipeptide/oligopeptide/nickel transport system permease subunit
LSNGPAERLNFIGDALRDFLDPRLRIEAGL